MHCSALHVWVQGKLGSGTRRCWSRALRQLTVLSRLSNARHARCQPGPTALAACDSLFRSGDAASLSLSVWSADASGAEAAKGPSSMLHPYPINALRNRALALHRELAPAPLALSLDVDFLPTPRLGLPGAGYRAPAVFAAVRARRQQQQGAEPLL